MNRLERLIREIKTQLFPYRNEHDIERGCERWGVGEEDCLTSWVVGQLSVCREKSKCAKKRMCAFYSYSDIARKNFEICQEVILILESGDAKCSFVEKDEES
ncbi:MAG TPA: hypothetical protein VII85_02780 [Candidatus Krumholzibacteriaceae bacterium]